MVEMQCKRGHLYEVTGWYIPKSGGRKGVRQGCAECKRLRKKWARAEGNYRESQETRRRNFLNFQRENPTKARLYKLRKYNLTPAEYDAMYISQQGRCAICGTPEEFTSRGRLCIDHVHSTGVIRGLLCPKCNAGLGQFLDDPLSLFSSIEYLSSGDVS